MKISFSGSCFGRIPSGHEGWRMGGYGPMDLALELGHVADGHNFRVR
jgi:hypothetical protein